DAPDRQKKRRPSLSLHRRRLLGRNGRVKVLMASRGVVPIEAGCGGAEIVAYQLAKNMAESGHDVTFVADLDPAVFEPTPRLSVLPVGGRFQAWVRRLPAGLPRWMLQHL